MTTAGLKISKYPYYDYATHSVRFEEMLACLKTVPKGDIVLLHGCCHNPAAPILLSLSGRQCATSP